MAANKHWLSDIVAGSGLGWGIGRVVVRRNGRPPDVQPGKTGEPPPDKATWDIAPWRGPAGDGRGVQSGRATSPIHPRAAAIDIGSKMHVAAVGPDRASEPVRTFSTFTDDLHRLADWFQECGIKTVAMESTGVYWIPVFEILEQRGFEVLLVNARDAKHVPGRKTDVSDAQWLQRLHEYGLLRASFRPQGEIAALRAYLRQRERLVDFAASHIQHMQKALMQMNVQVHHVVSDIMGVTGMRILRAIVAGERDPDVLASNRDRRCHADVETIQRALTGT